MEDVKEYVQVSEVMTRRPVIIGLNRSIVEAANLMRRHSIGSLLIVENKLLKGIITLEDIVFKVVSKNQHCSELKVKDVMSKNVVSVTPTTDIAATMELMNENGIKQLPVMDGDNLVGFLTIKDILRLEPALVDLSLEQLKLQEDNRQKHIERIMETEGFDIDEDLFE